MLGPEPHPLPFLPLPPLFPLPPLCFPPAFLPPLFLDCSLCAVAASGGAGSASLFLPRPLPLGDLERALLRAFFSSAFFSSEFFETVVTEACVGNREEG